MPKPQTEDAFWFELERRLQQELDDPGSVTGNRNPHRASYIDLAYDVGGLEQVAYTQTRLARRRRLGLDQAPIDPNLQPRGGYGSADPDAVGAIPAAQILSMISAWIASNPDADQLAQLVDGLQAIMEDDDSTGVQNNNTNALNGDTAPPNALRGLSAQDRQIAQDERAALDRRIKQANANHSSFQARWGKQVAHVNLSGTGFRTN